MIHILLSLPNLVRWICSRSPQQDVKSNTTNTRVDSHDKINKNHLFLVKCSVFCDKIYPNILFLRNFGGLLKEFNPCTIAAIGANLQYYIHATSLNMSHFGQPPPPLVCDIIYGWSLMLSHHGLNEGI